MLMVFSAMQMYKFPTSATSIEPILIDALTTFSTSGWSSLSGKAVPQGASSQDGCSMSTTVWTLLLVQSHVLACKCKPVNTHYVCSCCLLEELLRSWQPSWESRCSGTSRLQSPQQPAVPNSNDEGRPNRAWTCGNTALGRWHGSVSNDRDPHRCYKIARRIKAVIIGLKSAILSRTRHSLVKSQPINK